MESFLRWMVRGLLPGVLSNLFSLQPLGCLLNRLKFDECKSAGFTYGRGNTAQLIHGGQHLVKTNQLAKLVGGFFINKTAAEA